MIFNGFFITGTDTHVGKTIATYVLGRALQNQGIDVGVMKPVQCAGDDAAFLKLKLNIKDPLLKINPYFAKEALSPHLAFRRAKKLISIPKILTAYEHLKQSHEVMLVEGAGGLLVPIKKDYLVADLIREMELDVIVVSRLGLGTINHTLLTIKQAQDYGLNVRGVIFVECQKSVKGLVEKTNPDAIKEFSKVPILGTIPYIKNITQAANVLDYVDLNLKPLFDEPLSQRTKTLQKHDKEYLWHPFTQMQDWLKDEPLVIDRARGSYLIDTDGRRYIDGVSSLWVNVHGHGQKDIDRRIKKQVNRLSHSTLLGLSNTPAIELGKRLVEVAPKGLTKVFYSDNGSTSVEIAIKIAYQYWQNKGRVKKRKIAHLSNSYHGDTLGSVSVGGINLFHKVYRDLIFETLQVDLPTHIGSSQKDYDKALDKFECVLKEEKESIAALIVEPIVQGAAGMLMWPKGVLKRFKELCCEHDVLLIADEVATGFGRTGKMFACEHENVVPDILCVAKGLTGGYLPLAATLVQQRIYDGFLFDYKDQKTFFHGHTYTGNPLCCAAAIANLEVFKKQHVLKKTQPKIKHLSKGLQLFYNLSSVGDIRQRGMMVGIELVKDKKSLEGFPWEDKVGVRVCREARESGVILRPLGNVIVLMPPLSITKKEIDKLLEVTYQAIQKVTLNNQGLSLIINNNYEFS